MPFRRARTIDELAQRTAGYDLVLTADAPLALALNRRTDGPRLGQHATTPLNHAKRGLELPDRRELFHTVVQDTDIAFKPAATLLDAALNCWEDTGDRERILDWDRYDTPEMHAIIEVLATEPSGHAARQAHTVPEDARVAVIGPDELSPLDRQVLPEDDSRVDVIDPFHPEGVFELDPFHILPSTAGIVETLRAHITPENAQEVGIVLDPAGQLRPLVESMLEARSIPYHAEDELTEDAAVRAFLGALRLALADRRLTGRDVRGQLTAMGLPSSVLDDRRRLAAIDTPGTRALRGFFEHARGAPLSEAISAFEDIAEASLSEARASFEALGVLDAPVDRALLDALSFYLDTYTVDTGYTREGVLLASAYENAYVDRPLVFHLGIDADWTQRVPTYPWIDADARQRLEARQVARFERLLQSGHTRRYLVQDTRCGQPVSPCFHLHELLTVDFERFSELPNAREASPPAREDPPHAGTGFEHQPTPAVGPREVPTLSASDLDRLARCPRDWYMDQLVPTPDREAFRKGNLLHQFAELYVAHPEAVDVDDPGELDALVDVALEAMAPFVDEDHTEPLATDLRVGLRNIARWLDTHPPTGDVPDGYQDPPEDRTGGTNVFAEHLDVDLDVPLTERWFADADLGLHGKVDLVHGRTRLVDWKTGPRAPSRTRTISRSRVDEDDEHRYQPATYLGHHRARVPDETLCFTLISLLANRDDILRGQGDLVDIELTVPYYPWPFEEHVATEHAYEALVASNQDRQRVLEALGPDGYAALMREHDLPPFESKQRALRHDLRDAIARRARAAIGEDYKYIDKGADATVKKLVSLRREALFAEDLDAFDAFVGSTIGDVQAWLRTRFPVGETDLDDVEHPDLILRRLGPTDGQADALEVAPDG